MLHLALFATVFWCAIAIALELAYRWAPISRVIAWVLLGALTVVALMNCVHAGVKLYWMLRRHGYSRLKLLCAKTSELFPRTSRAAFEKSKFRTHVVLACLSAASAFVLSTSIALVLALFLASVAATIASRVYLPPAVLFLSASTPERLQFLHQLQKRVIFNVTALLDVTLAPSQASSNYGFMERSIAQLFDSRTTNDDDWKETAESLMRVVDLIVLDARDTSEGVLFEVRHILENALVDKTLFVADSPDHLPAIQAAGVLSAATAGSFRVLTEAELLDSFLSHLMVQRLHTSGA
jgi:hypothetical protein